MTDTQIRGEDIAIIGSGCRFPGHATSPSKLWDLLRDPHVLAQPIPKDRFSGKGFYHPDGQYGGHFNVKEAYFLADEGVHRRFDAFFFGMNPAEAVCLDPQCRLLLETVYEAMESAGVSIKDLQGSNTAMYTGQMVADYDQIMMRDSDHSLGIYHASGTSHAILSNRISYFFDWHGPSMTIDTACSSSLVAVHQAVQQLRTGQSRVAVAAGANMILDPKCFISLASLNMLSSDARCRMWDASAKGYARGEGIGAVILKTVKAALEDGDDIECIIRETAFGQDGKTQGITMPNPVAQKSLIHDAYRRAGLDLLNPLERPQFFECHGTGTLAGDAAEAQAITTAFFPSTGDEATNPRMSGKEQKLWVGSIKSIIGHTEGTAGIAGILRASLALKHATIPPNLLFENLNPRIEPFYKDVQVATNATPWPQVPEGHPRRASVNSFGFGGANVHAILESYEPTFAQAHTNPATANFAPFVFSAASEKSLRATLASYQEFLENDGAAKSLRDLAYTLHSRRTVHQFTTSIVAASVNGLVSKIEQVISEDKDTKQPSIRRVHRESDTEISDGLSIFGIFTGQGAQYAGMAAALIQQSKVASGIIDRLERRLAALPQADRPSWSLSEELLKDPTSSRISEAAISQPLCTAVQILQVELLRAAGIKLSAVVGHSSGEIGAAYTCGFLTDEEAICVAYYRGLHSHLAGRNGVSGSMMAVGTSVEDAQELCMEPEFRDRACVAAINSPVSVTLSGDQDAIQELKVIFDDERKFARVLKVDKAYHSHHMMACSDAYIASLAGLNIKGKGQQASSPVWFSSVLDGVSMKSITDKYWNDNMVNPVQFQQAVTAAYKTMGRFSLAIEIGPHPALQGPALQTMQDLSTEAVPYTSLFRRGASAVDSVAECFGYIWSYFGGGVVDLDAYDKFVSGDASTKRVVKGLPTYSWDHGDFWNESRYAKAITQRGPLHELLGHMTPDSNEQDLRWRQTLKPSEIPWLIGHKLQDQIVFPAAGYVATALEAANALCHYRRISASLIEVLDIEFGRALVFDDTNSSVEVIISMADITPVGPDTIEADFRYHCADDGKDAVLNLSSHGKVRITVGESDIEALPARRPTPPNLIKVPAEDFYAASRELDYQWAGPFTGLDKLSRKLGYAEGCINVTEPSSFLVHPTMLDVAFQGLLLGYSYPDDGQLWSIHVPGRIRHLSINPALCREYAAKGPLPFVSTHYPDIIAMIGNTEVFTGDPNVPNAMIQIEEMECVPLARATDNDDQEVFATIQWGLAHPDVDSLDPIPEDATSRQGKLNRHLRQWANHYMCTIKKEIPIDHEARKEGPYAHLLRYVDSVASTVPPEAERPTASAEFDDTVDMQLLHAVAELVLDSAHSSDDVEVTLDEDLLRRFYTQSSLLKGHHERTVELMKQLAYRDPNATILQVGAGTGALTQDLLEAMGKSFASYTVTDISAERFEYIQTLTSAYANKTNFNTFDTRLDPGNQGFAKQSFDVVVASLAIGAKADVQASLTNIRRLLKPGGRMIVIEMLPTVSIAYALMFSALPHFWDGVQEDQSTLPLIDLPEWDSLLREVGFSGCDEIIEDKEDNVALFVTQALDEKTSFIRQPLDTSSLELFQPGTLIEDLVVVGGKSLKTARLISSIKSSVKWHCGSIREARTLPELRGIEVNSKTTVLSLTQLDTSLFETLNGAEWDSLKEMLMNAGVLLWVTQGRRSKNPFAAMAVGMLRSIVREIPTLNYRMLDFEDASEMTAHSLATALLRLRAECEFLKDGDFHMSLENEVVVTQGGKMLVPRLVMNPDMNLRYNSQRRPIYSPACPHEEAVCVVPDPKTSSLELVESPIPSFDSHDTSTTCVEDCYSLTSAIRIGMASYLFALCGRDIKTGELRIGLSHTLSSMATFSLDSSIVLDVKAEHELELFSLIVLHLLTSNILRDLSAGDCILLYEPAPELVSVVAEEAVRKEIKCVVVSNSKKSDTPESSGYQQFTIHRSTTTSVIQRLLPANLSAFVDFQKSSSLHSISNKIRSILPVHCRRENLDTLFANTSVQPSSSKLNIIEQLRDAERRASATLKGRDGVGGVLPTFSPDALPENSDASSVCSIIDWTACNRVSLRIHPVATRIAFSSDKTYWFAGLSRGLGLALCEWMFRHGAKHFVISSRSPKIAPSWLQEMSELGVTVKVASCDVTSREQVVSLHREISETMPPIAGVCQGSMVLEDTAIREMTRENFLNGTRPKVEGSIYLDSVFQDNTLEFFIFFSSVVSAVGRPGQCNYSAANMFMASLAAQRRQKGLAASVMHIGPVYGLGYAAQGEKMIYNRAAFRSTGLVPTSERDFYQMFTEAVIAGSPGRNGREAFNSNIEILNGLRTIGTHDTDRPVWEQEPFMSHFVRATGNAGQAATTGQSKVPVKTQLAEATNRDQIYTIIQDAFIPKLYSLFQMDPLTVSKDSMTAMRLVEIGVDSLQAVEIRGWFMKTLEVNIPVLKILSGVPIHDLIVLASETIPERLVPLIAGGEEQERAEVGAHDLTPEIDSTKTSDEEPSSSSDVGSDDTLASSTDELIPERTKTLQLSFSQEMFWFIWAFLKDKTSLNHTAWARVSGTIDIPALKRAFEMVGQQHEILRTSIVEENGKPMQAILSTNTLNLETLTVSDERAARGWVDFLQEKHVYDVAQGQTMRAVLLSLSPTEHFFVAGLHPLVADGFSFQTLLKDVAQAYATGSISHLRSLSQYSDYSEKQHADMASGSMHADIQFWKNEFSQLPPPLPILTLSPLTTRPDLVVYKNVRARFGISSETKKQLQALCRRHQITPFHFYLAVFRALLLRYSPSGDGEDVVVGIGDANRLEDEMVDVIGPFVNFLPLRLHASGSTEFPNLLKHTREKVHAALARSKVPFQVLLDELGVPRSSSYTSLFQCFVNYRQGMRQSSPWYSASGKKAELQAINIGLPKVAYDVTLEMVDYVDGECTQEIVMRGDMYSQDEVERLAESYERLIKAFIKEPTSSLHEPDMFKAEDSAHVMGFGRGPSEPSQWPETVVHKIDQVGRTHPEKPAIWLDDSSTSFNELNSHTNAIASALADASVNPKSTVAVMIEPNPAFVASLLGVLRAGAVYLPLELSWPWPRLASVVADCQPAVVLVDDNTIHLVENLKQPDLRIINVSHVARNVAIIPNLADAHTPAALLYTSGSSGAPKGIFVKHEGLRNWTEHATKVYDVEARPVVLQQTTPTFDISLIQILTALCLGGSLCLVPRKQRGDAELISKIIKSKEVTLTCATPSEYAAWLQFGGSELAKSTAWKAAFSIGEPIPLSLIEQIRSSSLTDLSFFNLYGPTEASLSATGMLVPADLDEGPIAAGTPLPNYTVYVLDSQLRPVPIGTQGEVYIGGAGVGLGYHNRPEQTAKMFVPNVLATPEDKRLGWTMMHRTGDLGRWRRDGKLLIEGRIDTQIKIRGLRIDVSEIEHAIIEVASGTVREAVVTPRHLPSHRSTILVAHVVFNGSADKASTTSDIRSRLAERLPQYMCPAIIASMDRLPRTSAAKLDRQTLGTLPLDLKEAQIMDGVDGSKATLTQTEIQLSGIWTSILDSGVKVGPNTDFFHIGGSSILLLELQKNILGAFGLRMPLVAMFRASTLQSMAEWVDHGAQDKKAATEASIDWTRETSLPRTILDLELGKQKSKSGHRLNVVLTGATGSLGKAMLHNLLDDDRIQHVHCIGVRNAHKRQLRHPKTTFYQGDLVLPRLGLSEKEATNIFATADILIHNGSDMSYLKTYDTLRAVNLQSTKNLAEMCAIYCPGNPIPFHYISTVSVGNVATWDTSSPDVFILHPTSVASHIPAPFVSDDVSKTAHGYITTKWASEVFLERLHQRYPEWPVVIHRPSLIAREEQDNGSLEFVDNMRRYATLLNAVPAIPKDRDLGVSGAFDVVPLQKIVDGVLDSVREDKEGIKFLHHLGGVSLELGDPQSWVGKKGSEGAIKEMELGEWTRSAVEMGMHPTVASLLTAMASGTGKLVIPRTV